MKIFQFSIGEPFRLRLEADVVQALCAAFAVAVNPSFTLVFEHSGPCA
jgi:hypothetical protein